MKQNNRRGYFIFSAIVFSIIFVFRVGLQVYIFLLNKNIEEKDTLIAQQKIELENYKSLTGFNKLMAVKELEGKYDDIPRSTHIKKVIEMLEEVKNIDQNGDDTITLSDFNVNLESLSLRGKVSSLALLYYSNPEKNVISLIDRFRNLDFIKNLQIKNYNREWDTTFFSFVLEANVIKDAK
jgi:hypothetical protein